MVVLFPVKEKGLTVRLAELPDFAEGIGKAVDMALEGAQTPLQAPSSYRVQPKPKRRRKAPSTPKNALPESLLNDALPDIMK